MVEFIAKAKLPNRFGTFEIYAFKSKDGKEHVALVAGKPRHDRESNSFRETWSSDQAETQYAVPVRIHSKCFTGDTLCSLRCDCRAQLEASLSLIGKCGGVLIYLDQEGRGIGLANKIKAYALQEKGADTIEANEQLGFPGDMRDYSTASEILRFFKIKKIRLITNNPLKLDGIGEKGIEIVERIPLSIKPNRFNRKYLETKKRRMGHW